MPLTAAVGQPESKQLADVGRLVCYFGNDARQVSAFVESFICLAKFFTRRDEIRAAITVFLSHYPNYFMGACVVEELTQIIGLPNDSAIVEALTLTTAVNVSN